MNDEVKHVHRGSSTNRLALTATVHCLTGCSIGEILGMAAGAALHWSNVVTIVISVVLAFVFGYVLTLWPLLRARLPVSTAVSLALAADTLSILVMEIIDNAIMLAVPGAMDAHVTSVLFWGSLLVSLLLAGVAAYPVNRWLIMRGKGHARVHEHHAGTEAHRHEGSKASVEPRHHH